MKSLSAFFIFLSTTVLAQPGKYADTKKSLIGKTYTDSRNTPCLKGWTFVQGIVLNYITDPEVITADVFKKGTICLIVFSIKEVTTSDKFDISDVIEITGVTKGWSALVGDCSQGDQPSTYIVAWGKDTNGAYMNFIKKAWKFDPDRRKVNAIPVKTIQCENIGC